MKTTLIVIAIVLLIALGLFGFLYLLDKGADLDRDIDEVVSPEPEIPTLSLSSTEVVQGGTLGFAVLHVDTLPEVFWGEEEVPLLKINNGYVGAIGISLDDSPSEKILRAKISSEQTLESKVSIVSKNYGTSRLTLPKSATDAGETPSSLVSGIVGNDNAKLGSAMQNSPEEAYFREDFVNPTRDWVNVGGFGITRQSESSAIRHLGTDLEAEVGDPIFSINRGKVVLADTLVNYGNSIIVDHGQGIWSLYLHLSKMEVSLGDMVEKGQKIGEAGSTGLYSFEPHLHFSIRVRGNSIDPGEFIESFNKVLP